jgi:trimethylamine:corrinoid methyltransferase-like protein
MSDLRYGYPSYGIDLTSEMLQECCDVGVRLLNEIGMHVGNGRFLDAIRGKAGLRVQGERVHVEEDVTRRNIDRFVARQRDAWAADSSGPMDVWEAGAGRKGDDRETDGNWTMRGGGFSMAVIDIETDEVRDATCRDLRDLIRLADSYGIDANYPVIPQDVPPLMQAIAVFKIAWETNPDIRCGDYMDRRQTRHIYEMHKVMGRPFALYLNVDRPMSLSGNDLDIFLDFYPDWKRNRDIDLTILDYPMLGISKPVTLTGSIAQYIAEEFGVYALMNAFDPEIEVPLGIPGGVPTDFRSVCWAWGHPRRHLFDFLNSRILPALCGIEAGTYVRDAVLLESSSSGVDEQAGLEKMGVAMAAAFQGVRAFGGLGSLCVDDLFSGVQFVIDVEIVNYVRETVEAFDPHPDIVSTEGMFEMLRDVNSGKDHFVSHPDTVSRFRNILPSSDLIHREKLRSWMGHRTLLKDRAREECLSRIEEHEPIGLPVDKQRALDAIYRKAEEELRE